MKTINTKDFFYDYLPHVSPMRLKDDFGIAVWHQLAIRNNIQHMIRDVESRLEDTRYMERINAHDSNGEPYDDMFYSQLKRDLLQHLQMAESWRWFDDILAQREEVHTVYDEQFKLKVMASLGFEQDTALTAALDDYSRAKADQYEDEEEDDEFSEKKRLFAEKYQELIKQTLISMFAHDLAQLSGEELSIMKDLK